MKTIKEILFQECQNFVDLKYETINKTIGELQKSLNSETKSSAGDKHETGRAMVQLEREKAGEQLAKIQQLNQVLSKVNISNSSDTIALGSLVYTSNLNYFIAISTGELSVNDETFYAISANTPIGQLLLGRQVGDKITFRTESFEIIEVI